MKKSIVAFFVIFLFVFIFGCVVQNPQEVGCTEEAKICSDGSAVVRVGPNCEFAPCPNEEIQLPENCVSWYDGCNTCVAENGKLTACTLMYCETPSQPYCIEYANEANTNSQIANPASTNCIEQNGSLEIIDTNEGQIGVCTLPDGRVCEEWALFRGEC